LIYGYFSHRCRATRALSRDPAEDRYWLPQNMRNIASVLLVAYAMPGRHSLETRSKPGLTLEERSITL
jgi:hypothetical protein